jgi:hypothetical protein
MTDPQPLILSPFDYACVAAWHARRQHGEGSREYARALVEMEKLRPRMKYCPDCGRPAHPDQTCAKAVP